MVGLVAAVGAAAVVGRSHHGLAAEIAHGRQDTLVVGGDHRATDRAADLLADPPDYGLPAQQGQRFTGETRRGVTGRNDGDNFHALLFSSDNTACCFFVRCATASSYDCFTSSNTFFSGTSLSKRTLIQCFLFMCQPGPTPS